MRPIRRSVPVHGSGLCDQPTETSFRNTVGGYDDDIGDVVGVDLFEQGNDVGFSIC
jgi:hypothetical protein